jgi:glycosyltransferase involved in cell wall biosynthesis
VGKFRLKPGTTSKVTKALDIFAKFIPKIGRGSRRRFLAQPSNFENREGLKEYYFSLSQADKRPGVSALLRVKNEEDKIFHCLASIVDVFDEIVLIDNGSEDRTAAIVSEFQKRFDPAGRINTRVYPFHVSRCGPEHFNTPENSVHSIVYYNNWALSFCSRRFICKWDGDMVLKAAARPSFLRHLREIQTSPKACWWLYGQTVYRDPAGDFYLAKDEINAQIMEFPNDGNSRFYKHALYEVLRSNPSLPVIKTYEEVVFYELKFTDVDEFSNWSLVDIPTPRKQREQRYFNLVKSGKAREGPFQKLPASFLDDQIVTAPMP